MGAAPLRRLPPGAPLPAELRGALHDPVRGWFYQQGHLAAAHCRECWERGKGETWVIGEQKGRDSVDEQGRIEMQVWVSREDVGCYEGRRVWCIITLANHGGLFLVVGF